MGASFLPFSRPCISDSDIKAVSDVLRSGWITTGPKCAELEQLFKDKIGCRNAVALTSATAGMHLALFALGIGPGDEVITPSLTWVSTANLIAASGATPIFADVDRDSLMTSRSYIEPLITERTRLILPVHYAGSSVDMNPIRSLARQHNIPVIEDAAHALGTEYLNRPIGSRGTAIFSLHPIKNITTGEGGMFCTEHDALAERIRRLKFHGLGVDAYDRQTQGRSPQAEVLEPGFKYNLPDMNAALGLGQLQRLEATNSRRAKIAEFYLNEISSIEEISPITTMEHTSLHAWHLFVIRLDTKESEISRDAFMFELKKKGIGTGLHFRAVHTQKYYRENQAGKNTLPNTEWNSERICSLPMFPDITKSDALRVIKSIKSVLAGN